VSTKGTMFTFLFLAANTKFPRRFNQQGPARGKGDHMKVGNGWNIQLNAKPIPDRRFDWDFWHDDCDDENRLCGEAASEEDAKQAIKEIELDLDEEK